MTELRAIHVVAIQVAHNAINEWIEEGWGSMPDIGEYDYERVCEAAKILLPEAPSNEQWNAAITVLEQRARVGEETP